MYRRPHIRGAPRPTQPAAETESASLRWPIVNPAVEVSHIAPAIQRVRGNGHHHIRLAHQRFSIFVDHVLRGGDRPDIEVRSGVFVGGCKETRGADRTYEIRAATWRGIKHFDRPGD